jgi:hypothetical protein
MDGVPERAARRVRPSAPNAGSAAMSTYHTPNGCGSSGASMIGRPRRIRSRLSHGHGTWIVHGAPARTASTRNSEGRRIASCQRSSTRSDTIPLVLERLGPSISPSANATRGRSCVVGTTSASTAALPTAGSGRSADEPVSAASSRVHHGRPRRRCTARRRPDRSAARRSTYDDDL